MTEIRYLKPIPGTVEGYLDWARRHDMPITPAVRKWLPDAIERGNRAADEYFKRKLNAALEKRNHEPDKKFKNK